MASMAVYRVRQGLRAMFAFTHAIDYAQASEYLTQPMLTLFKTLRRGEQIHSLHVLNGVLAQADHTPRALAIAALMHDIGKTRYPLRLWQKTLTVLIRKFFPRTFERLSAGDPRAFLERPFVVYVHHPAWGAELLEKLGAPADAVWLTAHHADPIDVWREHPLFPLLARLHAADESN